MIDSTGGSDEAGNLILTVVIVVLLAPKAQAPMSSPIAPQLERDSSSILIIREDVRTHYTLPFQLPTVVF